MKKVLLWSLLLVTMAACNQNNQKTEKADKEVKVQNAGVAELLGDPAGFDGKLVLVEGMVTHVCRHGGQKCFILDEDGETQIRLVPVAPVDEFELDMEGSSYAFTGTFRVLNNAEAEEHIEDHESQEHHHDDQSHSQAEKAEYFVEVSSFAPLSAE